VQKTVARACWSTAALHVQFECDDRDVWGTHTRRDDPLYEEEVVEVFLAPGSEDPIEYYEFEVSPAGVLFDARVFNPESDRTHLRVDRSWDCAEIGWAAARHPRRPGWLAHLVLPFESLAPGRERPPVWRGNLYRIERPRDAAPEFTAWSPTLTDPPDFHKPARFGRLDLEGA
jgi:hypothetical protein